MNQDTCTALHDLLEVIDRLTGPDGCPWDRTQTPQSLADYVIEESHELVAAIRSGTPAQVCEELGDVMFLLLCIAVWHQRKGDFSLADSLEGERLKMIRRHPHVFAGVQFANLQEQLKAWEEIKKNEHEQAGAPAGVFASLPASLPPLLKAYRIHSRAARAGFTWPTDEDAEEQLESEWLEWLDIAHGDDTAAQKHELGDLIFTLVELGRRKGIKATEALEMTNLRFLQRFELMEKMAEESGRSLSGLALDELDELWERAKATLAADPANGSHT